MQGVLLSATAAVAPLGGGLRLQLRWLHSKAWLATELQGSSLIRKLQGCEESSGLQVTEDLAGRNKPQRFVPARGSAAAQVRAKVCPGTSAAQPGASGNGWG